VQDENDVTLLHSDFASSPRPERQALAVVKDGRDTVDAKECRKGDGVTKDLAAKFPSLLPPIKNGCENSPHLQQGCAKNVSPQSQRSQNLKV
jgi:hypothetical protein